MYVVAPESIYELNKAFIGIIILSYQIDNSMPIIVTSL